MKIALAVLTLFAFGCKNESDTTSATDTLATTTGASGGTISSLSVADKEFIIKAAQGGMMDVMTAQLAATRASSADVKTFASRMVTDHGKANDELKQLATNKGMALPVETGAEHKKMTDELAAKSGKDFDKAYMDAMVKDHAQVVSDFEKESVSAQDVDLRNWVTQTLPTLQDHWNMAKETAAKLK